MLCLKLSTQNFLIKNPVSLDGVLCAVDVEQWNKAYLEGESPFHETESENVEILKHCLKNSTFFAHKSIVSLFWRAVYQLYRGTFQCLAEDHRKY